MKIDLVGLSAKHPSAKPDTAPAIDALNLQVRAGEQLAVIGPSGAGKTTLLHLLACAVPPSAGQLQLNGQNPWQLPRSALHALRGQLFLAPQVPPLPPRQRVVTAVLAGRLPHESVWVSLRSLFYPTAPERAYRALAAFDLGDKLYERVDRLSGGERQRVGLARALVAQPDLLLVDEPLSALDPSRAEQALGSLKKSANDSGATLVVTLHHVEMALAHFPRILGLRHGTLAFDLPAAAVTPQHLHALYDQHLDELHGHAAVDEASLAPSSAPVVMVCR